MASRRAFLRNSLMAAGAAAGPSLFPKLSSAQTTGIPGTLMNAANGAHAICTANTWANIINASDWGNIAAAHFAVANYEASTGYTISNAISAAISQNPSAVSDLDINSLDILPLVEQIQVYQPNFTTADMTSLLSLIPKDSASLSRALSTLQAPYGFYHQVGQMAAKYQWMKDAIDGTITTESNSPLNRIFGRGDSERALYSPHRNSARLKSIAWRTQPASPFKKEGGGGGATKCQIDGALVLMAGTVFTCLAIMSAGTAPILVGAAWAGIATWGGYATAGWGLIHAMECGF